MKKLPSVTINIVEEEGWKPWSFEDRFGEAVADAAFESWSTLNVNDIAEYLSELIKPTRGPMVRKRWSVVTQEDLGRAAEALKRGQLEQARMMFQDASQWMYEEAGTPTDRDIDGAMEVARDENYAINLSSEWVEFADAKGLDVIAIAKKLVGAARYERKPEHYDRFITLSWNRVPEAKEFVKWAMKAYGMTEKAVMSNLAAELRAIADDFVYNTLRALQRMLEDLDWNNRAKWKKHWEAAKKEYGKDVVHEILGWLEKEPMEA